MNQDNARNLIQAQGAQRVITELEPYVTSARQHRIDTVIRDRLGSISLAIVEPADINNALATVRTAEALGISTVHIIRPEDSASNIRHITTGAFYWIDVHYHDTFAAFLAHTRGHYQLAGGTPTAKTPLHAVPVKAPLCILIGNEQRGLSDASQKACTLHYTIPMYGMCESFNLSVSAAISLYDVTLRRRALLGQTGDLTEQAAATLRARFYLNSVNARLPQYLFKN